MPIASLVLVRLLILLSALLPAGGAAAHPLGTSLAEVTPGPAATRLVLALAAEDVEVALGRRFYDREAREVPAERQAELAARLAAYLADRLALLVEGRRCPAGPAEISTRGHVVQVRLDFPCGERAGSLELESRLLAGQDPRFVQHVRIFRGDDMVDVVLRDGAERVPLSSPVDRLAVARAYLLAGIEHILAGADHLAFLLGLLLWARRPMGIVKVVTAFTLAHALTLTLGALDLVRVPMRLVDPLVALTVVWVGVENFLSREVDRRWKVALLLGLVHGLGFANALQEYGLPQEALALALLAFNLGVEAGQLALVAVAMPTLFAVDRLWPHPVGESGRPAVFVHGLSALLAALGLWWLAERTLL